jgi:hypothetical protein
MKGQQQLKDCSSSKLMFLLCEISYQREPARSSTAKKVSNTAWISIDSWLFTLWPHGQSVAHHLCAIDVASGPALVSAAGAVNTNLALV